MSKIVLSYAKSHFDPEMGFVNDGVGELSSCLWKALKKNFPHDEIIYADYNDYRDFRDVKDVKLFIGVSPNFDKFVRRLKPKQAILWSVNASARHRRQIIREARNRGLSRRSLTSEDGIFSNLLETYHADLVVVLGGWENYESYTRMGMPEDSVFAIGNGYSGQGDFQRLSSGKDILFFAGNITFRKGIHLIESLATLLQHETEVKLKIVGRTKNIFWSKKIEFLVNRFPEQIQHFPKFYDLNSPEWFKLIAECRFAILPTFEEGVSAAAAEVIAAGLPLLYSAHSGFEFTRSTPFLNMESDQSWVEQVEEILKKDTDYFVKLLAEQQQLLLKGSESNSKQIERLIARLAKWNSIWPNFQIVNERPFDATLQKLPRQFVEYKVNILEDYTYGNQQQVVNLSSKNPVNELEMIKIGVLLMDRYYPIDRLLVQESENTMKTVLISRASLETGHSHLNRNLIQDYLCLRIAINGTPIKFRQYPWAMVYIFEYFRRKIFYRILNRLA